MANFDINTYDPVVERIKKFWAEHPNGSIIYKIVPEMSTLDRVLYYAEVYADRNDPLPIGADCAYGEIDTLNSRSVNAKAWHENASTSAVGRALANANFLAKIDSERPSQEEMVKAGAFERPVQAQGYQRNGSAPRQGDGETFPDHFARNMKTVDLVEFAKKHDFRGTNVRQLRDEIEQTFKVKIAGSAPDGGCLPVDVGNALAYYVNELSTEQKEVIAAGASDEGADGLF